MLDALDTKLVNLLEQDARQNWDAVAGQLGISPSSVRRRVRRLIRDGVVSIAGIPDHSKAGFTVTTVVAINVDHKKVERVIAILVDRPDITWLATTTGRFDIIAHARFASNEKLSDFLDHDLANIDGIINTETFVCLRLKKWRSIRK